MGKAIHNTEKAVLVPSLGSEGSHSPSPSGAKRATIGTVLEASEAEGKQATSPKCEFLLMGRLVGSHSSPDEGVKNGVVEDDDKGGDRDSDSSSRGSDNTRLASLPSTIKLMPSSTGKVPVEKRTACELSRVPDVPKRHKPHSGYLQYLSGCCEDFSWHWWELEERWWL